MSTIQIEPPAPRGTVIGTCLVAGGSGFLGINLVRLLLQRGVRVRSLPFYHGATMGDG